MSESGQAGLVTQRSEEIEVTPEMMEAGAEALAERYLDLEGGLDLFPQIVRSVFVRMMEARSKSAGPNTRAPSARRSALERMDRIHSEFERRKRLGLPYPSLDDLDRLFDRPILPPTLQPQEARRTAMSKKKGKGKKC